MPEKKVYAGACHCGRVCFEARPTSPKSLRVTEASICSKHGLMLTFVGTPDFSLLSGEDELAEYQFNKHVIAHQFCRTWGVEPFARGKRPDGQEMVAVNVRCLDDVDIATLSPTPFDGRSL